MLLGLFTGGMIVFKPPIPSLFCGVGDVIPCNSDGNPTPTPAPTGVGQGAILTAITITPPSQDLGVYAHQQFMAAGTYSDNSVADVTNAVTWTSDDPLIASINGLSGEAIALKAGTAHISASALTVSSNQALLTVTDPCGDNADAVVGTDTYGTYNSTFGVAVALTLDTAAHGSLTFCGVAGQHISVVTGGSLSATQWFQEGVKNPNGSDLFPLASHMGGFFTDQIVLPQTGSYTIDINPDPTEGVFNTTVYNVTDLVLTTTIDAATVPANITVPGQNATVTFFGTSGEHIVLSTWVDDGSLDWYQMGLKNPDGNNWWLGGAMGGSFSDQIVLAQTGLYTVILDPIGADFRVFNTRIYNCNDLALSATIGGPAVTANIALAGQNAAITFTGHAGNHVSISTGGIDTMAWYHESVQNPNGSYLLPDFGVFNGNLTDSLTLPADGTYKIYLDPNGATTANFSIRVNDLDRHIVEKITDSCATSGPERGYVIREGASMDTSQVGGVGINVSMWVYIPTITGADWASRVPGYIYCTNPAAGDQWYQIALGDYAGYYIFAGALDGGDALPTPTPPPTPTPTPAPTPTPTLTPSGTDLALTASVSREGGFTGDASITNDGNDSTMTSLGGSNYAIVFDLGSALSVGQARVKQGANNPADGCTIGWSNNGTDWTDLPWHSFGAGNDDTWTFTPQTARYWRFNQTNAYYWDVYTMSLWAA
jgi:hypothetical protein